MPNLLFSIVLINIIYRAEISNKWKNKPSQQNVKFFCLIVSKQNMKIKVWSSKINNTHFLIHSIENSAPFHDFVCLRTTINTYGKATSIGEVFRSMFPLIRRSIEKLFNSFLNWKNKLLHLVQHTGIHLKKKKLLYFKYLWSI